jgi:hypothetical protein
LSREDRLKNGMPPERGPLARAIALVLKIYGYAQSLGRGSALAPRGLAAAAWTRFDEGRLRTHGCGSGQSFARTAP